MKDKGSSEWFALGENILEKINGMHYNSVPASRQLFLLIIKSLAQVVPNKCFHQALTRAFLL